MTNEIPGQCRYFLTYSGVRLPFQLKTPLEPEQIENRNTYFRGYFDEQGRLTGIQKIVHGEAELQHRYSYDERGMLRRVEITDADGEVTVLHFDEAGKPCLS